MKQVYLEVLWGNKGQKNYICESGLDSPGVSLGTINCNNRIK